LGAHAFDVSGYAKTIAPIPAAKDVFVKIAIHGGSGVGKTRLATSYTGGKVLFGNIEDGYLSIAGSGIDYKDLRTEQDFRRFFLYLKSGDHPYKMAFIDSFTEAKKFFSAQVAQEKVANRQAKNPYQLSMDDYKQANETLRQWLWDMRSLPMHIVYICLSATQRRQGELRTKQVPDIGESLAGSLLAYSSVVGYMEIVDAVKKNAAGEEEPVKARKLWLQPVGDFDAKIRMPVGMTAPEAILSPTLDKIIGLYSPKEAK
jgi:hypothetical protein